ncbi:MAG: phage holin family protein [Solirubrobacterales bacterium]|nr:phage holin family protein [Solirubrobacterales bacterium]
MAGDSYGEIMTWHPQAPRLRLLHVLLSWLVAGVAVFIAAAIVPGVSVGNFRDALAAAVVIAALNAVLPPVVAALRLPFTLALGFVIVLVLDAAILLLVSHITSRTLRVSSFGWALVAALVISAAMVVLEVIFGVDDDDAYSLRVIRRIARRQGNLARTDSPGIVFLEIDGLARPVLQRAIRDGNAPHMASWLELGTHHLVEWEPDLSSQTGASQAGILLGSNDNIPAFRWVEKARRKVMACSSPEDCAEIERRLSSGDGLLAPDGASRGNLFSGDAEAMILTVSQVSAEKRANPGYRAFLANGFNVSRLLVLFFYEALLEKIAAIQQRRRNVRPRGNRGGLYPLLRASLCVGVRDLIVYGVLTDMMRGRPVVYATFSSYDEVAHHSGLERSDTLEALRKLDKQFGRIDRARRYAPRPYQLVVLSDHGQTQGATFKQRNGYDLQELVERSLTGATVARVSEGDENDAAVGHAVAEATGRSEDHPADSVGENDVIVLGSGNLGLIYLMHEPVRLHQEEIEECHPQLLEALRRHPHIGFLLVRSRQRGPVVLGPRGARYLADDSVQGEDPLAPFAPGAADHLRRTDGFEHVADIMVNSFYDAEFEQGCAFEELISFHGGLGGPQTQPFILYPVELPLPAEPIRGAAAVHDVLMGWRRILHGSPALPPAPPPVDLGASLGNPLEAARPSQARGADSPSSASVGPGTPS